MYALVIPAAIWDIVLHERSTLLGLITDASSLFIGDVHNVFKGGSLFLIALLTGLMWWEPSWFPKWDVAGEWWPFVVSVAILMIYGWSFISAGNDSFKRIFLLGVIGYPLGFFITYYQANFSRINSQVEFLADRVGPIALEWWQTTGQTLLTEWWLVIAMVAGGIALLPALFLLARFLIKAQRKTAVLSLAYAVPEVESTEPGQRGAEEITAAITKLHGPLEAIAEAVQEGTARGTSVTEEGTARIVGKLDEVQESIVEAVQDDAERLDHGEVKPLTTEESHASEVEPEAPLQPLPAGYEKFRREHNTYGNGQGWADALKLLDEGETYLKTADKLGMSDRALANHIKEFCELFGGEYSTYEDSLAAKSKRHKNKDFALLKAKECGLLTATVTEVQSPVAPLYQELAGG